MRRSVVSPMLFAATLLALVATKASAQPNALRVAGGGGLGPLEVSVEATHIRVHRCAPAGCAEQGGSTYAIPVTIEPGRIDKAKITSTVLPIGEGKNIVRVVVPEKDTPRAFEALIANNADSPIFAGQTGLSSGAEGERWGQTVLVYDKDATTKFVLVADLREDTRICGQAATPLHARGLDPKSMELRGATLHKIEKAARDEATELVAKAQAPDARPALGRLLTAVGASAAGGANLTDHDAQTVWSEDRSGDGHGEFVTMRAPSTLPLHALVVTIAPNQPSPNGAAPKTFFVATDHGLFHVTMPEDAWKNPGARYEIALPEPIRTTCVSLVLDEAYARPRSHPTVSIAEVSATTTFDAEGRTLAEVAQALGTDRGDEAKALLDRAGEPGILALGPTFPSLDARGRMRALDVVASAGTCEGPGTELLTRALVDDDREIRRRALGRIERCGKAGASELARVVREGDERRRAAVAPLLASISPAQALAPIAERFGRGSQATRQALRRAFAHAAASADRQTLLPLVQAPQRTREKQLDLLRALGAAKKLPAVRAEATDAVDTLLRDKPDLSTRYLLAGPIAALAGAEGASVQDVARLRSLATADPAWPVRTRAVELAAELGPMATTLERAATDPEPRVREAAFVALRKARASNVKAAARAALASEDFTFVRLAAARALASTAPDPETERVLAETLEDRNPLVRIAAISAASELRLTSLSSEVAARLDDDGEYLEVRVQAARALGAMCVQDAQDRLTELALLARSPVTELEDRLGLAAIEALGALHPRDLETRLAPLRGAKVRLPARLAADRALQETSTCHSGPTVLVPRPIDGAGSEKRQQNSPAQTSSDEGGSLRPLARRWARANL